jgi:hypothetical protein
MVGVPVLRPAVPGGDDVDRAEAAAPLDDAALPPGEEAGPRRVGEVGDERLVVPPAVVGHVEGREAEERPIGVEGRVVEMIDPGDRRPPGDADGAAAVGLGGDDPRDRGAVVRVARLRERVVALAIEADVQAPRVVAVEVGVGVLDAVVPDADGDAGAAIRLPDRADVQVEARVAVDQVPLAGQVGIGRHRQRGDRLPRDRGRCRRRYTLSDVAVTFCDHGDCPPRLARSSMRLVQVPGRQGARPLFVRQWEGRGTGGASAAAGPRATQAWSKRTLT